MIKGDNLNCANCGDPINPNHYTVAWDGKLVCYGGCVKYSNAIDIKSSMSLERWKEYCQFVKMRTESS